MVPADGPVSWILGVLAHSGPIDRGGGPTGAVPVAGSAAVLIAAALVASLVPAARAARVDVMQALRSD